MQLERRAVAELRTEGRNLVGHAALFNTETRIGLTREVIRSGAFRRSLQAGADVRAFVDHDHTRVLGRTRSGTLQVSEDARGLAFSIDMPATSLGEDILELGRRGDLSGMSFGFRAVDEKWSGRRRELRDVDLVEISVSRHHSCGPPQGGRFAAAHRGDRPRGCIPTPSPRWRRPSRR
jgi:uncharacterized protein